MKVLHFYRTYFPDTHGGLEETIRQICNSTKPHSIESRVLTLSPNPHPKIIHFSEADVYRARLDLDIASCSMGIEVFSMFRELEAWADIIHYHFPWPFADVVKLWSRSTKPCLITYHSDIVRQSWLAKLYSPLMNTFLKDATRIVATSPNYVKTSRVLKKHKEKLEIIPIGIDENLYPALDLNLARDIETRYGANYFLFIGVLRQYKGLQILLEAIKNAPFSVLIAGKGPLETTLKKLARTLELRNVHFLGYVPNEIKVALLHRCRAVILSSNLRSEAFGVSLLEGAMATKPLISMAIGTGTSYINLHGETGLVSQRLNAAGLREIMDTLYHNRAIAESMGANARIRYEQLFTASRMGEAYKKLYEKISSST